MQTITSAATSINSTRAPAIYGKRIVQDIIRDRKVLDYGGGKYDTGVKAGAALGAEVWVYDPYNRPEEQNRRALSQHYDVALCSNVLNVINDEEARVQVIADILRHADTVVITVYEGNHTSVGKPTRAGWQENRQLRSYLREVAQAYCKADRAWTDYRITNGCIILEMKGGEH